MVATGELWFKILSFTIFATLFVLLMWPIELSGFCNRYPEMTRERPELLFGIIELCLTVRGDVIEGN